jgi:hypothetical protein
MSLAITIKLYVKVGRTHLEMLVRFVIYMVVLAIFELLDNKTVQASALPISTIVTGNYHRMRGCSLHRFFRLRIFLLSNYHIHTYQFWSAEGAKS